MAATGIRTRDLQDFGLASCAFSINLTEQKVTEKTKIRGFTPGFIYRRISAGIKCFKKVEKKRKTFGTRPGFEPGPSRDFGRAPYRLRHHVLKELNKKWLKKQKKNIAIIWTSAPPGGAEVKKVLNLSTCIDFQCLPLLEYLHTKWVEKAIKSRGYLYLTRYISFTAFLLYYTHLLNHLVPTIGCPNYVNAWCRACVNIWLLWF